MPLRDAVQEDMSVKLRLRDIAPMQEIAAQLATRLCAGLDGCSVRISYSLLTQEEATFGIRIKHL